MSLPEDDNKAETCRSYVIERIKREYNCAFVVGDTKFYYEIMCKVTETVGNEICTLSRNKDGKRQV